MNKLQKKVASAVAAGTLLLNLSMPVLAGTTTLEISGNGRDSDNEVAVVVSNTTTVVQSNEADINNDVDVNSNTGNNSASDNVGEVEIETGDIDAEVAITNAANTNVAEVDGCCEQDVDVLIEGNGRDSENNVDLVTGSQTALFQDNEADIENDVEFNSNTGDNDADDNGGEVTIKTGSVDVSADIKTMVNSNSAYVGGDGGLEVSARIVGNLRDTDNTIGLSVLRSILLTQANEADVENDVDVNSNTGDNGADDNFGEVMIDTGDIDVEVMVDTMANFNWADAGCDCLGDVWTKIADNLRDSDNEIKAAVLSDLAVFQGNCSDLGQASDLCGGGCPSSGDCELDNDVDVDSNTGENEADDNGGGESSDPAIETGDVDAEVELHNSGNTNVYGESEGWEITFPWMGEKIVVNVNVTL